MKLNRGQFESLVRRTGDGRLDMKEKEYQDYTGHFTMYRGGVLYWIGEEPHLLEDVETRAPWEVIAAKRMIRDSLDRYRLWLDEIKFGRQQVSLF